MKKILLGLMCMSTISFSMDEMFDIVQFMNSDKYGVAEQIRKCENAFNNPQPCYKTIEMLRTHKNNLKPYSYWKLMMNQAYLNAIVNYRDSSSGNMTGIARILNKARNENEGLDPINYHKEKYISSNRSAN